MKYLKQCLTLSIFIFSPLFVFSCDCIGNATFCESASENGLILELEVEKIYAAEASHLELLDFSVNNEIYNNTTSSYNHLSFVEYGTSCDLFLGQNLKVGDRIVVTFGEIEEIAEARYPVFLLPFCSATYLVISNGKIGTFINDASSETTMSYEDFKNDVFDLCEIDYLGPSSVQVNSSLTVENFFLISDFDKELAFDIIDASGRRLLNGMLLAREEKLIEISGFPAGVYFVRFRSGQYQLIKKVIKV